MWLKIFCYKPLFSQIPSASNIIGLIAGGDGEAVRQVADVTQPYKVATITTQASHTVLANSRRFPALIRMAPGNDVTVRLSTCYTWWFYLGSLL